MSVAEYFDTDSLEMLKEVMEEEFDELLVLYIKDAERHLVVLGEAVEGCQCDDVIRVAHSLKGASSNVYARKMFALCMDLENATRAMEGTPDWAAIQNMLSNIDDVFDGTRLALQTIIGGKA